DDADGTAEDPARLVDLLHREGDPAALGLAEGRLRAGQRGDFPEQDLGRVGAASPRAGAGRGARTRLLLAAAQGEDGAEHEERGAPRDRGTADAPIERAAALSAGHGAISAS